MGLLGRLVVGIDGSDGSAVALRWAAAQAEQGEVIAVHGYSPAEQLIAAAAQINLDSVRSHHEALLQGPWTEPAGEFGVKPKCEMLDDSGANALMVVASNHGSATIVVGHEDKKGWTHQHVGGNVGKLLHRCSDPLIVTNSRCEAKPISGNVVVGISGTADLESAHLEWATRLATEFDLSLILVGINQPPSYFDPEMSIDSASVVAANAVSMRKLVGRVRERHPRLKIDGEVRSGVASTEIAAASTEHHASMVVLGNHHPSLAAALLSGSMLRHLPALIDCPMAAVPATWKR